MNIAHTDGCSRSQAPPETSAALREKARILLATEHFPTRWKSRAFAHMFANLTTTLSWRSEGRVFDPCSSALDVRREAHSVWIPPEILGVVRGDVRFPPPNTACVSGCSSGRRAFVKAHDGPATFLYPSPPS